jgi:transcriptional regulator with XRE-family HTH domain
MIQRTCLGGDHCVNPPVARGYCSKHYQGLLVSQRMPMAQKFALALRTAMTQSGIGVLQLSALTGIHNTTLSGYRNAHRVPDLPRADRLAEVLDSPKLRDVVRQTFERKCIRCSKTFLTDGRNISRRRFCGRTCRTMTAREHTGRPTPKFEKLGPVVKRLEMAVAEFCGGCEPEGVCRDSGCALRAVSPLPLIQLQRTQPQRRVA